MPTGVCIWCIVVYCHVSCLILYIDLAHACQGKQYFATLTRDMIIVCVCVCVCVCMLQSAWVCDLQARQDTLRCSMPFLERGGRADSLAAAMIDLEDQSGVCALTGRCLKRDNAVRCGRVLLTILLAAPVKCHDV